MDLQITNPALHTVSRSGLSSDYSMPTNREMLYLEHDGQLGRKFPASEVPLYVSDSVISGIRSPGTVHLSSSFVTQVSFF